MAIYLASFCLAFIASVLADDQTFTTVASFIGGAGSKATNANYTHISSWRQPIQTSISSGGGYVNYSGYLGAVTDTTFNILSYNFTSTPSPSFQVTISTIPGQTYAIQFADNLSSSLTWKPFLNSNQAVGTFLESNSVPATFTFTDDFTSATSGGPSITSARFYRVVIQPTSTP
jgi:hypothetical protein